ncbi:MAG: helix-turn-helix domain-containing protein [Bacteroidaceae bacterium]|nr:helix-turn-helix domain-containing protein [Bacteroidaceae bacterium]
MKRIYTLLCTLTVLLIQLYPICTYASKPSGDIRQLTYTDGMRGEDVNKILKDRRGLIWIATNKGVNCYNGRTVVPFGIEDSDAAVQVKSLVELPDGNLFAATDNGIYHINLTQTRCNRVYPEIANANALCVAGEEIIAGTNRGIYVCTRLQATHIPIESNAIAKNNRVNDMIVPDDSTVWFCTNDRIGRLNLPAMAIQMYDLDHSLFVGNLTTLCKIGESLFIGTEAAGVLQATTDGQAFGIRKYAPADCIVVNELSATGDSLLHICSDGLLTINVKTNSMVSPSRRSLDINGVYSYHHDEELDVDWTGYFVEGLSHNYHTRPLFATYRMGDFDTRGINVRSFHIHGEDILIGSREGMYCISEADQSVHYLSPEALGAHVVTNINYWGGKFIIATYGSGLHTYDPMKQQLGRASLPAEGNFSRLVVSPDSSYLIAAGNLGVYIIDKQLRVTAHYDSHNSELSNTYIPDVHFDHTGKAWISTLQGMAIYDPRTGMVQTSGFPEDYFNNEPNLSFNPSLDGDVIAFSTNKVYKARTDLSSYTLLPLHESHDVGAINFIFPYADSLYWVGANKGLFLFDRDLQGYMQFNESDGLPSLRFSKQEYAYTPDGTLWMGTNKGLVYLTPEAQRRLTHHMTGSIMIEEMLIDGRKQEAGFLVGLTEQRHVTLQWNFTSEQLTCTPMLLDYSFPSIRYYEYALDGSPYRQTEIGNVITLQGLSLGRHTLRIRVAGREETGTEYHIHVVPSPLFYFELLFLVTLGIALYSIYKWNENRKRLRIKMREKYDLELRLAGENAVRIHEQQQMVQKREAEEAKQRERDRRTSSKEYKELYSKVKEYMELEKPYKRSSFGLSELASAVGSSPTMLSLMFNQRASTTFYDFVAQYRIEEFKRMATSDKFAHLTVTAISERCGFKKSTFFATFKRIEGCTPTEWLKREGIKRIG